MRPNPTSHLALIEIKVTAYSADRIQFDGQSCILAVSEDLPEDDQQKVN